VKRRTLKEKLSHSISLSIHRSMAGTMSPMTEDSTIVTALSSNIARYAVTSLEFASARESGQVRSQSSLSQVGKLERFSMPNSRFHNLDSPRYGYNQREVVRVESFRAN
jgi:hypothetical protein